MNGMPSGRHAVRRGAVGTDSAFVLTTISAVLLVGVILAILWSAL